METRQLGAALAAAMLTATAPAAFAQTRTVPASAIMVTVVSGAIQVSNASQPSPVGAATLDWQLGTAGYRFTDASLNFGAAQASFSCTAYDNGRAIRCNKSAQAPKGKLPYTIRLSDGKAMLDLPQPSIFIQNE